MNSTSHDELWGHPKGLYVCFLTEMWERFSFYGMKALLLLFLVEFHRFDDKSGLGIQGAYSSMVYFLPLFGGMLADRYLGARKAVIFGGVLLCLGHFGMAFEGVPAVMGPGGWQRDEAGLKVFFLSLSMIIMGVGFLKANISTIVGKLYAPNDARRDSAFSLFYMGINAGAALGATLCGVLAGSAMNGAQRNWSLGFGAAGVFMVLGLTIFIYGSKHFHGVAEAPDAALLRKPVLGPISREVLIYLGAIAAIPAVWWLIQHQGLVFRTMFACLLLWLGWWAWYLAVKCDVKQRQQMVVLMILIACALIFFTLYEQTYNSWTLYASRVVDRDIAGTTISEATLTSLGAWMIMGLALIAAFLWPALEKRGMNPSTPVKTGIGLIVTGLAFFCFIWGSHGQMDHGKIALGWFVLAYFVIEVGEVLLSPVGLSAVTALSVPQVVNTMMGGWFLATAFSEFLAAETSKSAALSEAQLATMNLAQITSVYNELFLKLAFVGIGCGALILILSPWMKRWMHGVK